jgi:hypothetical protein
MRKPPVITSENSPRPGSIIFGPSRGIRKNMQVYSRIFRCRKDGFDFMGQIKIDHQETVVNVEVFNEHYFDCFDTSPKNIISVLEKTLLTKLLSEKNLPASSREAISSLSTKGKTKNKHPSTLDLINDYKVNLKEIFDKLNTEYFESKIEANIEWGKKVNKKNLASFRFGSYDPEKRLIRIHPRLQQGFVPLSVLELTVHHEMCHQWAPMKRERGMWIAHHQQFKGKEREYRFYNEARSWEKENWKKLMGPASKTSDPIEQTETIEITTLTG